MRCARLNLQERPKSTVKLNKESISSTASSDKPRRYCQQRMVDPDLECDPRWTNALERFHWDQKYAHTEDIIKHNESIGSHQNQEEQDLYLTVQTLKFEGHTVLPRRPKSCFKYKTPSDRTKHRLFIKQTIDDIDQFEEDRTSTLSSYFLNDYAKYLQHTDKSRPPSGKSSIFLQGLINKIKQNKSTQVDLKINNIPKTDKKDTKNKKIKDLTADKRTNEDHLIDFANDDTKVTFDKTGKRKCLTISRAPSPETVQVIRVDVVCNRTSSCSTMTDYDDDKKIANNDDQPQETNKIDALNIRQPNFYSKYLLTNTIKSLDQNLTGSKVTLLCKTFRLSDRSRITLDKDK